MAYKAVFLDRDNTLIEDPGYINHPKQVKLLPGVSSALNDMRKLGFKLVVVSNQSGVARGIVTEDVLSDIHEKLLELLRNEGVFLDAIYYCPYHPEGVIEKYRKESNLRKPQPGMLLMAADDMNIDLKNSWMVGDTYRDIEAGKRAGCKTILVHSPATRSVKEYTDPEPDCSAINIKEAVNIIKMSVREGRMPFNAAVGKPEEKNKQTDLKAVRKEKPQPPAKEILDAEEEPVAEEPVEEPKKKYSPPPEPVEDYEEEHYYDDDDGHEYEYEEEYETGGKHLKMLHEILDRLNRDRRNEMFEEFSLLKVVAGAMQVIVFFGLAISVWILLDQTRDVSQVHTMLGFTVVFQLMAISFFIMDRK